MVRILVGPAFFAFYFLPFSDTGVNLLGLQAHRLFLLACWRCWCICPCCGLVVRGLIPYPVYSGTQHLFFVVMNLPHSYQLWTGVTVLSVICLRDRDICLPLIPLLLSRTIPAIFGCVEHRIISPPFKVHTCAHPMFLAQL